MMMYSHVGLMWVKVDEVSIVDSQERGWTGFVDTNQRGESQTWGIIGLEPRL
jgi:hypothetical protein